MQDGAVGLSGGRLIGEHEEQPGGCQKEKQNQPHSAQAPGVCVADGRGRYGGRMEVKDKGVQDRTFSLLIVLRDQRGNSERPPDTSEDVGTIDGRFFAGYDPSLVSDVKSYIS